MKRDDLRQECRLFARYLVGEEISEQLIDRYIQACERLFPKARRSKLERLANQRPMLLPLLDAGAGFLAKDDSLRTKLLVLSAILEASPVYTHKFLPERSGGFSVVAGIFYHGLLAGTRSALGIPLVYIVGGK